MQGNVKEAVRTLSLTGVTHEESEKEQDEFLLDVEGTRLYAPRESRGGEVKLKRDHKKSWVLASRGEWRDDDLSLNLRLGKNSGELEKNSSNY